MRILKSSANYQFLTSNAPPGPNNLHPHRDQTCYEVLKACFKAHFCQKNCLPSSRNLPRSFLPQLLPLLASFSISHYYSFWPPLQEASSCLSLTPHPGDSYQRKIIWSPVSSVACSTAGRLLTVISLSSFVKMSSSLFFHKKIDKGKKIN
jgi:hypothetical protein